jgi:hypothetical protein
MQVKAALCCIIKVIPPTSCDTSARASRLLLMGISFGSSMWCCMSTAEVEQVVLAAHPQPIDSALVDDAMRIVTQHLPDITAVCPYQLVCRFAAFQGALRIVKHNA